MESKKINIKSREKAPETVLRSEAAAGEKGARLRGSVTLFLSPSEMDVVVVAAAAAAERASSSVRATAGGKPRAASRRRVSSQVRTGSCCARSAGSVGCHSLAAVGGGV